MQAAACLRAGSTVALEMHRSGLLEMRQVWNWQIGSTMPWSRSVFNAVMMFPRPPMDGVIVSMDSMGLSAAGAFISQMAAAVLQWSKDKART
jgi:hypothetical protein